LELGGGGRKQNGRVGISLATALLLDKELAVEEASPGSNYRKKPSSFMSDLVVKRTFKES
jgi:hypothetical protein